MRQADRAANDVGLSKRRVVHAVAAELPLQPPRHLEHTALALHLAEVLLAGDVGHVFAEHEDARVAAHLVLHADVEKVHHGGGIARELWIVFGVELFAGRVHIRRVDAEMHGVGTRLWLRERIVRGGGDLGLHFIADALDVGVGGVPLLDEPFGEAGNRITGCVRVTFFFRTVEHFVVRQRVRVGANHAGMHERRTTAFARIGHGALHDFVRRHEVAAIHLLDVEPREALHDFGNRAARRVDFDRHGNRVAVVFDEVHHGQAKIAGRAQ